MMMTTKMKHKYSHNNQKINMLYYEENGILLQSSEEK